MAHMEYGLEVAGEAVGSGGVRSRQQGKVDREGGEEGGGREAAQGQARGQPVHQEDRLHTNQAVAGREGGGADDGDADVVEEGGPAQPRRRHAHQPGQETQVLVQPQGNGIPIGSRKEGRVPQDNARCETVHSSLDFEVPERKGIAGVANSGKSDEEPRGGDCQDSLHGDE